MGCLQWVGLGGCVYVGGGGVCVCVCVCDMLGWAGLMIGFGE